MPNEENNPFWQFVIRQQALILSLLMLCGFAFSLATRLLVGGTNIAHSPAAGLCFALCLTILVVAKPSKISLTPKVFTIGILGAAVLCLPSLWLSGGARPLGNYPLWVLVVGSVALAEEAFFRGTLFDCLKDWRGNNTALVIAALGFALLHVPLYGWQVFPLDLVAGIWLGQLRLLSGTWVAPGITHTLTDLAFWWLR